MLKYLSIFSSVIILLNIKPTNIPIEIITNQPTNTINN